MTGEAEKLALDYFDKGYNCAQSVFLAFAGQAGLDEATAAKLALSFGGGMGGMGEVCGALSGALMAAGLLLGGGAPLSPEAKEAHYALVKDLGEAFRQAQGSLLCRDLKPQDPALRDQVCGGCVSLAARLLADKIK